MARFLSFLVAIVVLLSAAAEIASFAIDHRSWLEANYDAMRDYVVAVTRPEQSAAKTCEACPGAPQADAPRCDGIEPFSKKVLCYFTLPRTDTGCAPNDCAPKNKSPLPGDWIHTGKKGNVASSTPPN
jgi:hypothetical protein